MQTRVFEYDPQQDEWLVLPDMTFKRAFMATCQLDGKVYFMGGNGLNAISPGARPLSSNTGRFISYEVNRYDRHSFPSIYGNSLCEDSQGRLWIGSGVGLCCYDRKLNGFVRHQFDSGFSEKCNLKLRKYN